MNFPRLLLALLLLVILSACGPSPEQQATMTATALTATAAMWTPTPTVTLTPTPTNTPTPTVTPTPTLTSTPTQTPTDTATPTQTLDPNYYYAEDKTFSLIAPQGWKPENFGLEYDALVGPKIGDAHVNLSFAQVEVAFPMAFYSALVQDSLEGIYENLVTVSEEFLVTDEGKDYFRWEFTASMSGVNIRQVVYFYESGDWKLMMTYSRLADQGAEYDALADEAAKTMRYTR